MMHSLQTSLWLRLVPLAILNLLVFVSHAPAQESPDRTQATAGEVIQSEITRARKEAARRQRRIIFNDDGGDLFDEASSTPEGFLGVRLKRLADTHVDTISWSVTKGDAPNYDSKIQPIFGEAHAQPAPYMYDMMSNLKSLIETGHCPLGLVVNFAHEHGMEVFASLRMNDVHDSFWHGWVTRWKKQHPQFLVNKTGMLDERKLYITSQDFSHAEVRQRKFEIIEEVCDQYDIDGVELDYIRHPVLFGRSLRGLAVNDSEVAIMTRFMRRTRKRMDEIAARRGRPLLLAARVPDSFELARNIGLDLNRWVQEGLVDLLIPGGGYAPHSLNVGDFAQAAHEHDVLVYPCYNTGVGQNRGFIVEDMRALATNWHRAGADGIYLWNMYGPSEVNDDRHRALIDLGELRTLAGKDKLYGLDGPALEHYAFISSPTPLPRLLQEGMTHRFSLAIGDALKPTASDGLPSELRLELKLQGPVQTDMLRLRLNGELVPCGASGIPQDGECKYLVTCPLSAPPLRMGENTIEITLTRGGGTGGEPVNLCGVHLWVKYE